eukprot:TRINITY_DN9119_c0_g1_i1.p1 TRINITY_DN9119_c0_g1~~TRINITY_DN9119_c0_g1_i1.p1  ORF type:complete len:155 (-),score=43.27 TRINITY_DN9119_c0_g1_i1:266-730(-)
MIRRPPRSTQGVSSAASDVYKRQVSTQSTWDALKGRGARGIFGLQRVFKIVDDNNSRQLSLGEFKKVLREYRLKLSEAEGEELFRMFDRDHSGEIDYDEFLRAVVGEMSQKRKNIVAKVFKSLDRTGDGVIAVDDIKELYNAARHPDVISGKKN